MFFQNNRSIKRFVANLTLVWLSPTMNYIMSLETGSLGEFLPTYFTLVRLRSRMYEEMRFQISNLCEEFVTDLTFMFLNPTMNMNMCSKIPRFGE